MPTNITAKFVRRRFEDSGRDQAPDYYVYEFTNIIDSKGKKYPDKWIKETKLMRAVPFARGQEYQITLSQEPYSFDSINLPYPKEVSWKTGRVYMKGGNSIIKVDEKGQEKNLSVSFSSIMGIDRSNTIALNKFTKGLLTPELLKKMNAKGVFFYAKYVDPQDKRKSSSSGVGYTTQGTENFILIRKETQKEIDNDLKLIKSYYIKKPIEKYFRVITEILPPKKRK